jgi:CheY-like chemotaxis protein
MDKLISLGHPFYFPTQVVLLDDDPDFLEGISLMLPKNLSFKLFQSPNAALEYVNSAHLHTGILKRCYTSYRTGPQDSDALTHIDIGKLHLELLNGFRFQTCSTVIVDYSMPGMNGLEFLRAMKNPFIRKILLTGQADMELAIRAFNQQLIDQFIDKHDPRLKPKLNAAIATFQEQYFRSSFKLVTDPILANNMDGFLTSAQFQEFFAELCRKTACVEYYMLDYPHSGFLLVDAEGKRQCLLVYTQADLEDHCMQLMQVGAPQELLQQVRSGQVLPVYDVQAANLDPGHPAIRSWGDWYYPARKIAAAKSYFATLVDDSQLPDIHGKSIHSYRDFLETNNIIQQIVH